MAKTFKMATRDKFSESQVILMKHRQYSSKLPFGSIFANPPKVGKKGGTMGTPIPAKFFCDSLCNL
jgi:hypothetical protein